MSTNFKDDGAASKFLQPNFYEDRNFTFRPRVEGYKPTPDEKEALAYLVNEWDYGYDPRSIEQTVTSTVMRALEDTLTQLGDKNLRKPLAEYTVGMLHTHALSNGSIKDTIARAQRTILL